MLSRKYRAKCSVLPAVSLWTVGPSYWGAEGPLFVFCLFLAL